MVSRQRQIYKLFPPGWTLSQVVELGEVEVSQNDLIVCSNHHASKPLQAFKIFQKTDGTDLTYTQVNNQVTITSAVVNAQCIYTAYGFKP